MAFVFEELEVEEKKSPQFIFEDEGVSRFVFEPLKKAPEKQTDLVTTYTPTGAIKEIKEYKAPLLLKDVGSASEYVKWELSNIAEGYQALKTTPPKQVLNELKGTVIGRGLTGTYGLLENVPTVLLGIATFVSSMGAGAAKVITEAMKGKERETAGVGEALFVGQEKWAKWASELIPEGLNPQTEAGQRYQQSIMEIFGKFEEMKEVGGEQWAAWVCDPTDKACQANVKGYSKFGTDVSVLVVPIKIKAIKSGKFGKIPDTPLSRKQITSMEQFSKESIKESKKPIEKQKTTQEIAEKIEPIKPETIPELVELGEIIKRTEKVVEELQPKPPKPEVPKGEAGFLRIGKKKPPKLEFTEEAKKVEQMYEKAEKASKEMSKRDYGKLYRQLKRATIDVSGNIRKTLLTMQQRQRGKLNPAEEVVMKHELIAGASPKSSYLLSEANKKIFKDLFEDEQIYLNRIIQSRRTLEIEAYKPEVKHPEGLGGAEHTKWLEQLPEELKTKLNKKADLYFKEMKEQTIDQLLAERIISQESYNALAEHIYSPRELLEHIYPEEIHTIGGKKITVPDSGIKTLEEGTLKLLENDASLLLSKAINKTQARIFRNRANKTLYDLARELPDNGVVTLAKVIRVTKEGKPIYQPTPKGFDKIKVMVDGQPKEMLMPSEMAMEWITKDPLLSQTTATYIRWLSGSAILKPMATGLNPEFAITNFPRDIAHIWLTDYRKTYSSTLPIYLGQMGKDLKTVAKDAIFKKGRWDDYTKEGGMMEFLTQQGWSKAKDLAKPTQDLQNFMGWLGITSEMMPRLALRERAMKAGYTPEQATWLARNYLDFSQGGSFIKAVDTGVPYLNPAFQASRGVFRSAALEPALFTYKMAQLAATSVTLMYINRFTNPEAWENIPSWEKAAYFIILTPFDYKDKEGNKRYIYFRIAKDQTIRPIVSAFNAMAAKAIGDEVDIDEVVDAVREFSAIQPTQMLPPTFDAILGYLGNKDFWRNEEIWRRTEPLPYPLSKEEYTEYTHPLFVKAGKLTGLSPERLKYSLEQYFTSGNVWTSIGGHAWKIILDEIPEAERQMVTEELILKQPFIRRIVRSTQPAYKEIKKAEKIKIKATVERFKTTREFDSLSQGFYDEKVSQKDIDNFLKKLPIEEEMRLKKRHFRRKRLQELPERRWWLELAEAPPETRALIYWNRWRTANEEERKMLEKNYRKVPGVMSGRFVRKLNMLKRKPKE